MIPHIMHNFYLAILNKNRMKWNTKSWFSMKVILIFTHWIFINAGCRQGIYDKKSKFDDTVCMLHIVIFWKIKFYRMNPNKYYIRINSKNSLNSNLNTRIWTKFTNIPIWHYFLFDISFKLRLERNFSYDATKMRICLMHVSLYLCIHHRNENDIRWINECIVCKWNILFKIVRFLYNNCECCE